MQYMRWGGSELNPQNSGGSSTVMWSALRGLDCIVLFLKWLWLHWHICNGMRSSCGLYPWIQPATNSPTLLAANTTQHQVRIYWIANNCAVRLSGNLSRRHLRGTGTGRTGFMAVPPNNYPFYSENEKYKPIMQADGGQLSGTSPLYVSQAPPPPLTELTYAPQVMI